MPHSPQAQVFYPPQFAQPNGYYPGAGTDPGLGATVAILKTEVTGIKQTMADLSATVTQAIGGIQTELKQRGQIPWATIGMALSLVFSVMVYFANANLRPLENDVRRLDVQAAKTAEVADARLEKVIAASDARTEKMVAAIAAKHEKFESEVVPFRFHQIKWTAVEEQIKTVEKLLDFHRGDLQRQSTANTERLNAIDANQAKNAAADNQERIRTLEAQLGVLRADTAKLLSTLGKSAIQVP